MSAAVHITVLSKQHKENLMTAFTPNAIEKNKKKKNKLALIISTLSLVAVSTLMLTLALIKSRMVLNQNMLKLKHHQIFSTVEAIQMVLSLQPL